MHLRIVTECIHPQDYFEIVKKPMDLGTIRHNLDSGVYKDPWEFVDDVWLMIDNAWLYNKKTSRVHKYASKVVACDFSSPPLPPFSSSSSSSSIP